MKICYHCGLEKNLSEFNNYKRNKDGKHHMCKCCKREYDNRYYKNNKGRKEQVTKNRKCNADNNKRYIIEYLSKHPCVDCGESDPFFLEFDHIKGEKKDCVVNLVKHGRSALIQEIEKCEVRCVKCHKIVTAKRAGWYDSYYERIASVTGIGNGLDL